MLSRACPSADPAVGRNPVALPIGAAMIQALGSPLQGCFRDRLAPGEESDNSAHADVRSLVFIRCSCGCIPAS